MRFNLNNEYERVSFKEYIISLLKKGGIVEVNRKAPQRSLKQNAYLHVILGYFASEYGVSIEEAKCDFFKRQCNKELFEREGVNRKGKSVKFLRSSADLSSAEMTLAIERFRNWSASVAEIYIPAPHEEEFLEHCRKMMERDREFI